MKAMILAAGFGTRLRPYSQLRPKPLFPILNLPLLGLTIAQLRAAGFTEILVNTHYLAPAIIDFLRHEKDVTIQREPQILGTGGGLRRALSWFGSEPVLVINGDIVCDLNLRSLYDLHCASGAAASLVVHDLPRFNNVWVDDSGNITGFGEDRATRPGTALAFTGIHIITPQTLAGIAANTFSSIIEWYRHLISLGTLIKSIRLDGHYWTDIGTLADYLALHRKILTRKITIPGLPVPKTPFWIGAGCMTPDNVTFIDWVCIGPGVRIGKGAILEQVVAWPGCTIPDEARCRETLMV